MFKSAEKSVKSGEVLPIQASKEAFWESGLPLGIRWVPLGFPSSGSSQEELQRRRAEQAAEERRRRAEELDDMARRAVARMARCPRGGDLGLLRETGYGELSVAIHM